MKSYIDVSVVSLFIFIFLLICSCESNENTNNNGVHRDLDQYRYVDQQEQPSPPSHSPNGPRLIGLDVKGRVRCLLWKNPMTWMDSTLAPLFSSLPDHGDDDEEDPSGFSSWSLAQAPQGSYEKRSENKQWNWPKSVWLPGAVFGTADYRFRKQRWYGVEKFGMMFRWNFLYSLSHSGGESDEQEEFSIDEKRNFLLPTTLDITGGCSLFSPSNGNHNRDFITFIDSGNLRVGWQQSDGIEETGARGNDPWIQIGFGSDDSKINYGFLETKASGQGHPFRLGLFLPLIHRRLDLQWTSHWNSIIDSEKHARREYSLNQKRPNEDPWWIPRVSLDPSMGTLSSKNRYRKAFSGGGDRQYLTDFKLRIRTTMPTILSSVTNDMVAASDDEDDLQFASVRLECSLMADPGEW
eukprot:CAMPEP_0201143888 /NCGR_PEP_ID=MMETSP0851-20130426/5643_1 /ASSEMBLY_ACC=CAM_ASM_000631 /TAXON_ID=183588 /ORGANISM="Pseudo-nitzschia fraudulenta, Strain WWA7" /LENGTH=408 /DNA_ID=CAMNT_0047418373 /DNA_START=27 /DNA_END=1250 /DNA_ORIENTATION=-